MDQPELSIVIPMFNEGPNVELLFERLTPVLERIAESHELLFVDDGSSDDTFQRVKALAAVHSNVRALAFSRNFGKEIALAAGIDNADGKAVILMDADLQHPPEFIERFVTLWREGYEMVYGQRVDRSVDGPLRRLLTRGFYRLFADFGETPLPEGAGDFRLLDRKVVLALRRLGERARFSKGLYAWVGFKSIGVPFEVAERAHGTSKWSFRKLFSLAANGITSFSTLPLKVWIYVGMLISLCSLIYAGVFLLRTLVYGVDVPGFPSLFVSVMFFSGIQMMSLGILGEYIGRIFAEVKRRPLYIVAEEVNAAPRPAIGARDDRRANADRVN